jgi:bifunctional non-homologous end joining protein LigD
MPSTTSGCGARELEHTREQHLEGLVAKRRDSLYQPGQRSGAWRKMRVNQARNS